MAPSHFKLAKLFPNLVSLAVFHNKLISSPARQNIKTCHKNCNILILKNYFKIIMSKVCSKDNIVSFALLAPSCYGQRHSALNKSIINKTNKASVIDPDYSNTV